jgi:c-di-GMP-binding flagellar brake protein YcgR
MSTTTTSTEVTDKILSEACSRNTPVELHYEDSKRKQVVIGRARILQLSSDSVLIDRPMYRDGDGHIPLGRPLRVYLLLGHMRYTFKSAITASDIRVRLNEQEQVPGIALRRPTSVAQAQRRGYYRMSLAGSKPIDVELARVDPRVRDACPIDGRVGTGRMHNLSARGVALLVPRRTLGNAELGEQFYLTFRLPGIDDEICVLATVKHAVLVQPSNLFKIGLAFVPWAGLDFDRCQTELTRVIANLERRMLRRKKR